MNKKRKIQWTRILSVLLCLALVIGLCASVMGLRRVEPDDPIVPAHHEIPQESGPETQPAEQNRDLEGEKEEQTEPTTEPPTEPTTEPATEPTEPSAQPTEALPPQQEELQPTDPTQGTDEGMDDQTDPSVSDDGAEDPTAPTASGGEEDGEVSGEELHIVTDLSNRVITFDALTDDKLSFFAYIVNGEADMYLRAKIRNSKTSANGTYLTAVGRDYTAALARQENNYITLYLKQGEETVSEVTYVIRYVAKSAGAEEPQIGEHPPTVSTNLDDFEGNMTNRNFTFLVTARTYDEKVIYASNIIVTMDGVTLRNPTGSNVFEYELTFPDPVEGDFEDHYITVLAWDDNGNSTYREFKVTYGFVDSGSAVGTATVYVDATPVGLDPWTLGGGYTYTIKQDEPASYAVLDALEAMGYSVDYARTLDDGFYIRRLSRGGMCDYADIPDNLWQKILDDGLALTGQHYADSLGEQDYTQGSGWMYSINGTLYAGKGLSEYYLSDGDAIYLRFTLAYGKDIGGYGGNHGTLPTYCGMWLYGGYTDLHRWGEPETVAEATCTEPGVEAKKCSVCGDEDPQAELPALGHDHHETARQEPAVGTDGYILWECSRCGDAKTEIIPMLPEPSDPAQPSETEPSQTGPAEPSEPETSEPTEPTESGPSEPETSEPTEPTESEPTGPTQTEPSAPPPGEEETPQPSEEEETV